jgi:HTH-type transcriptional regulator / antitoxin HigA
MKHVITSKKEYHETMVKVYRLMDKGEENLKPDELKQLAAMAVAAEKYENEVLGLKPQKEPRTIIEAVELKMFEKRISQARLADLLGLGQSKLSDILNGKRKPDIPFLKALYKILKIDPGFLLEHA